MSDNQAWMVPPPIELHAQMNPPAYDLDDNSDSEVKKEIRALTQARTMLEQELILKSLECDRLRSGLCECGLKCRPPNIMCNTCVETKAKQKKQNMRDENLRLSMQQKVARQFAQKEHDERIQLSMQQKVARQFAQKEHDERIRLEKVAKQRAREDKLHSAIEAARAQRAAEAPRGSIYRQPHTPLCKCGQARREKDMWCGSCATQRNNASIIAQKPERDRIMKGLRISKLMQAAAIGVGVCFIPANEHEPVFTHESI